MSLTEADRRKLLVDIGLEPDGEQLARASATPEKVSPAKEQTAVDLPYGGPMTNPESVYGRTGEIPDLTQLTDAELVHPLAFARYSLQRTMKGIGSKSISSPHNRALNEAINRARASQRKAGRP